jgi:hypothetical protein
MADLSVYTVATLVREVANRIAQAEGKPPVVGSHTTPPTGLDRQYILNTVKSAAVAVSSIVGRS